MTEAYQQDVADFESNMDSCAAAMLNSASAQRTWAEAKKLVAEMKTSREYLPIVGIAARPMSDTQSTRAPPKKGGKSKKGKSKRDKGKGKGKNKKSKTGKYGGKTARPLGGTLRDPGKGSSPKSLVRWNPSHRQVPEKDVRRERRQQYLPQKDIRQRSARRN